LPKTGDNSVYEVKLITGESIRGKLSTLGNGAFLSVMSGGDSAYCVPVDRVVWIRDTPR